MKLSKNLISVMMVSPFYPPVVGGAEVHAGRLSSALMRRGHKVRVLTTASEALPDSKNRVDPNGVPVTTFKANTLPLSDGRMFVLGVVYTLLANRRRYQIAHFLLPGLHTLIGVATARAMGRKAVVMFGGCKDVITLQNSLPGRLQLYTIRRLADQIITLNDEMKSLFQGLNFPDHKIISLPCGVDEGEFAPVDGAARALLRQELGLPARRPLVTFTGRFVPEKELGTLISAFERVHLSRPEAMLVLAGDGPLAGELKRQVAALGLGDDVRFTGFLQQESIRKLLQASDIFALVSATEGIPCSLVEAMSVGLPSVVSDIAGTQDLIRDGVQGLRVNVRDAQGLAQAVIRLIEDESGRLEMGKVARAEVLDRYALDSVAARYEQLYRSLLKKREKLS